MRYSDEQIDCMLNGRLRRGPRPTPWPTVALHMGLEDISGLEDLFWKVATGYSGNDPHGPRRQYKPTKHRHSNRGLQWQRCDWDVMDKALAGQGQRRKPACDFTYVAAILGRNVDEVEAEWNRRQGDPLGRAGFGFMDRQQPWRSV